MVKVKNSKSKRCAQKLSIKHKSVLIALAILGLIGIVGCGYGHAALSSELTISGVATINATNGFRVKYMQELTSEICERADDLTMAQLVDERDNKIYWVAKLPDGKCWMTQNLDYDGGGKRFASNTAMADWVTDEYSAPRQYYYVGDNGKGRESDGSYYSYASAMEVCPAGWHLPAGGPSGDYATLLSEISYAQALDEPYYFRLSGYVGNGQRPAEVGSLANYRSMAEPGVAELYTMVLYNNKVNSLSQDYMDDASSVRCIVGEQTPMPMTIYSIASMQELTPEICDNTPIGADKRLTDTRDSHKYWVAKLPDGKCWMTQNLDYNGGGTRYTDNTIGRWAMSGEPRQYYYGGDWKEEHSSYGSYYSIPTALTVCPVGWRLPTQAEAGTLWGMIGNIRNLRAAPYYFLPSGYLYNAGNLSAGDQGYWLTATEVPSGIGTYSMAYIASANIMTTESEEYWYNGFTVRCVAR